MRLSLTPDELLSTTRAVRRRLDLGRPVEREVLLECVELAIQAPTGSNKQGWQWFFVEDPSKKAAIAEIYRGERSQVVDSDLPADADPQEKRIRASGEFLTAHLQDVPTLMIPLHEGRPSGPSQASFWGSLLPAVWSFCLAARSRGLGTSWTTWHLTRERDVADVVGISYEDYTQAGLFPIAYTVGTDFKPAPRRGTAEIVHWDHW